jgi:hypothetical protein
MCQQSDITLAKEMFNLTAPSPENQQDNDIPNCKVHMVAGCLVVCDGNPLPCKWFISFGYSGFCQHPSSKQFATSQFER